jgi:type VI protein secretion system component Hcp
MMRTLSLKRYIALGFLVLAFYCQPIAAQPPAQQNVDSAEQKKDSSGLALQISCYSLLFDTNAPPISNAHENKSHNSITCFAILNDFAFGMFKYLANRHRFQTVVLVWMGTNGNKSVLDAGISNAVITNIRVSQQDQLPVEEITFQFEKLDVHIDGHSLYVIPPDNR